jgi:RNA polymerase sigma factor (sigma-70 family)
LPSVQQKGKIIKEKETLNLPENQTKKGHVPGIVEHFFRHEAGRMTAVLTRIFGPHNLSLAEDVVQDSLLEAMSVWEYKGVPENPAAWLYRVARNKALNIVNRERHLRAYAAEALHSLKTETAMDPALGNIFEEDEIADDQLRMMFTCCHPSVSEDSQVALILKTLCGFSIAEIAKAFITSEENVSKRLKRARQTIREAEVPFEVPHSGELEPRLRTVLQSVYLLFNEGYSASTGDDIVRHELCAEAIRLCELIMASAAIREKTEAHACAALMYFNAARLPARVNDRGELLKLAEQDRKKWDGGLISRGFQCLETAMSADTISNYFLLATISAHHCAAADFVSTDWNSILQAYDKLAVLDPSPVVFLNRAIAVSMVSGAAAGLAELDKLRSIPVIREYYLYYSTRAEFLMLLGEYLQAAADLNIAIGLSKMEAEKRLLETKLAECNAKSKSG